MGSNHTEIFKNEKNKRRVKIVMELLEKLISRKTIVEEFTLEQMSHDFLDKNNVYIGNLLLLEEKLNQKDLISMID